MKFLISLAEHIQRNDLPTPINISLYMTEPRVLVDFDDWFAWSLASREARNYRVTVDHGCVHMSQECRTADSREGFVLQTNFKEKSDD